jgi:hypothetical protein
MHIHNLITNRKEIVVELILFYHLKFVQVSTLQLIGYYYYL